MALPQINTPTYELEVPSTGEKLKYRPFLVKEEKILMIAMEAEEQSGIINAVKEIVKACTFDKFDVSRLPIFDVEYVFLNIRAKSVGEVSKIKLKCLDDNETFVETEIDLTKVNVEMTDGHTNKIELTDEMGIIYDKKGEEIFEAKDSTQKELNDFLEQLNTNQFQEVQKFFDTMPKLTHTVKIKNPKTKKESKIVLSGLNDFFG